MRGLRKWEISGRTLSTRSQLQCGCVLLGFTDSYPSRSPAPYLQGSSRREGSGDSSFFSGGNFFFFFHLFTSPALQVVRASARLVQACARSFIKSYFSSGCLLVVLLPRPNEASTSSHKHKPVYTTTVNPSSHQPESKIKDSLQLIIIATSSIFNRP